MPDRPTPPRNGGPSPVDGGTSPVDRAHGRHECDCQARGPHRHECDYCRRVDSDDEPASEWWYWQREGFWLCDDCYQP